MNSFTYHLATVSRSTSRRIGVLMRLRKLIPTDAKLHIYKAAVLPYFQYCSLVWHFCRASDRRKLEKINERGLRAVFCDWRSTYGELLERAKLKTLHNMRLQDIAVFMYKVKNKLLPSTVLELFETKATQYILRNADFNIPRYNSTSFGKHSLRYFGPYLWSKLKYETRTLSTLSQFKKNIKNLDLEGLIENNCPGCVMCNT